MAIDAIAEPRDAPHPREAAALADFLLRPGIVAEATAAAGLTSAETVTPSDNFRALWPIGVYDAGSFLSSKRNGSGRGRGTPRAPRPPRSQDIQAAERDAQKRTGDDRRSAEHPHRHGRSDGAGVPAGLRPSARPRAAHRGAGGKRRRVRERLLQQPAVFAFARLVHGGPAAVAHAASTTTPPNSPPTSRPSPITCSAARLPHRSVRQDAFLRAGPAAWLRRAADHRHLSRRLRLDAGLGPLRRSGRAGITT